MAKLIFRPKKTSNRQKMSKKSEKNIFSILNTYPNKLKMVLNERTRDFGRGRQKFLARLEQYLK